MGGLFSRFLRQSDGARDEQGVLSPFARAEPRAHPVAHVGKAPAADGPRPPLKAVSRLERSTDEESPSDEAPLATEPPTVGSNVVFAPFRDGAASAAPAPAPEPMAPLPDFAAPEATEPLPPLAVQADPEPVPSPVAVDDVAEAQPFAANPVKKASNRQARQIVSSIQELPANRGLLTKLKGGLIDITEAQRRQFAAIETSANVATLLVTEAALGDPHVYSVRSRIERAGMSVVGTLVVTDAVLLMLYRQDVDSAETSRRGDDDQKADSVLFFEQIIADALDARATDIHWVVRDPTGMLLFRIDGSIYRHSSGQFPSGQLDEAVGVAYNKLADENSRSHPAYNRRQFQSCTIPIVVRGQQLRLRYQSVPCFGGFDVVMRVLFTEANADDDGKDLRTLGYSESQCHQLEMAARRTAGLILVTGVTGSGKTTTLRHLQMVSKNRRRRKSYSIEDPVEYKTYGITQVTVQRAAEDSKDGVDPFAAAMRVVLRADPDVVTIGEIRDVDSCALVRQMVQSGHQVMGSLHADSVFGIPERMSDEKIGLSRQAMSGDNFFSAMVYQRLVPLLCAHCKLPARDHLPPRRIALLRSKYGLDVESMFVKKEEGCPYCEKRGTKGSTVVAEVVSPSPEMLTLWRKGWDTEAKYLWRATRTAAFDEPNCDGKTAFEHGLYKVAIGLVDPSDLEDGFEPLETYRVVPITHRPQCDMSEDSLIDSIFNTMAQSYVTPAHPAAASPTPLPTSHGTLPPATNSESNEAARAAAIVAALDNIGKETV